MLWLELALIVIGGGFVAVTLFPFSPMTLKFYMPSRSSMIALHRNRVWLRAIGLGLLGGLGLLVLADESSTGWGWATLAVVGVLVVFYAMAYVPIIMRPPPRQHVRTAAEADEVLVGDVDVLGIEVNGEHRAYRRGELARPHVAFDSVGGAEVAITYCILCNTAVGFLTEIDGRPMRFRAITAFNNNIIYYDSERKNYIQQLDGAVIAGPDEGTKLASIPITLTSWEAWRGTHPDTAFVDLPPTGLRDKMMTKMLDWMIPLPGLARRRSPWHPVHGAVDSRLPAMSMVVGVESGETRKAYPLDEVRARRVVNDEVGGEPIVVLYDPEGDTVGVYSRRVGERVLSFHTGSDDGTAVDDQTARSWTVDGVEQGADVETAARLEPFPNFSKLFWFSWAQFKPGTEIASLGPVLQGESG